MDSQTKKNLWLGLGALGAFVAAALVWHYVSTGDDDDDDDGATPQVSQSELLAELEKRDLTKVKKNDDGLDTTYFLRVLNFIGETNKKRTAGNRAKTAKKRRKHYEKKEWDEYAEIVKASFLEEDMSAQAVMSEVTDALGIGLQEFQMMHQGLMTNPASAEAIMAAQRGSYAPPDLKKKPTLSKQKTMEVFKITQKLSLDMMDMLKKLEQSQGEDQEKMLTFMIEQLKMHDEVFFSTGVENEEFEDSLMIHMRTDPTVQQEI